MEVTAPKTEHALSGLWASHHSEGEDYNVFWGGVSPVDCYQCFGGTHCFHLQERRWSQRVPSECHECSTRLHTNTLQKAVIITVFDDVLVPYHLKSSEIWHRTCTLLKEAKGLISGPSAKRMKDLLKLNRDQLRWVVGLLTGHCHVKGYLFNLGLTDNPTCERCLEEMNQPHIFYVIVRPQLIQDFVTWASSLWNQVIIMTPP
jgi:hypothetical protein